MTKSGKHCGKRRNCLFLAISSFVTVFKRLSAADASESIYMRKRVKVSSLGAGDQSSIPGQVIANTLKMVVMVLRVAPVTLVA